MKILVTGAAGFIGFHTARALLDRGDEVVGLDNLNEYFDVRLKQARLARLQPAPNFRFLRLDLADRDAIARVFASERFNRVVHLGARPGVRGSVESPFPYVQSNVVGTLNVLEGCRQGHIEHLVFASSSSVYGANTRVPHSVRSGADHPLSLYAATKKSCELMAHAYAMLYGLPVTGLRFFTVYGPWGRPDMALYRFTRNILHGEPINLYNHGDHRRDFTYVEDVVNAIAVVLDRPAAADPEWDGDAPDPSTARGPYRLYNVGAQQPVDLRRYVRVLESCLERKAIVNPMPLQPGDILESCADVTELSEDFGYRPQTTVEEGVKRFVDWYLEFHGSGR